MRRKELQACADLIPDAERRRDVEKQQRQVLNVDEALDEKGTRRGELGERDGQKGTKTRGTARSEAVARKE